MKNYLQLIIGAIPGVVICLGDLKLKKQVEEQIGEKQSFSLLGGFLGMQKYHNYGAFLNNGQKHPKLVCLLSVVLCLIASVIYVVTFTKKGSAMLSTGLVLLLGGAYSNTYDRLKRKYVVDYVSFPKLKPISHVIFNISDFCIMIGAMLIALGTSD